LSRYTAVQLSAVTFTAILIRQDVFAKFDGRAPSAAR
jgi:hypothetical protein